MFIFNLSAQLKYSANTDTYLESTHFITYSSSATLTIELVRLMFCAPVFISGCGLHHLSAYVRDMAVLDDTFREFGYQFSIKKKKFMFIVNFYL